MDAPTAREIRFEWDVDDPLRFIVHFDGFASINLDSGIARRLANSLNEMARRADARLAEGLRSIR